MDAQLKRGLLDICVLTAIKNEDSYGYKIIKDLKPYIELTESTLYTILKRLCEKGIFQNERGTVTSRLSLKEFQAKQSETFVEETFDGSLPDFVAAFVSRKKLTEAEIKELKKIIDEN